MKLKRGQSGSSRRRPCRSSGLTLTEMTVVIAVVALLTVLSLPAVRSFFASLANSGNARPMISAALSSARAIAAKEQRYAGIRFQTAYDPSKSTLDAPQYMIFIVQDPEIMAYGFRAVEGLEPMKLPSNVGVMEVVGSNGEIVDSELTNKTTFSILFSPSGKMVIHNVRVRNRDGTTTSKDDIFNTESNVRNGIGMFLQDENSGDLKEEPSQSKFRIYDKTIFEKLNQSSRYDNYLKDLEVIYINPYTGTIVNEK